MGAIGAVVILKSGANELVIICCWMKAVGAKAIEVSACCALEVAAAACNGPVTGRNASVTGCVRSCDTLILEASSRCDAGISLEDKEVGIRSCKSDCCACSWAGRCISGISSKSKFAARLAMSKVF